MRLPHELHAPGVASPCYHARIPPSPEARMGMEYINLKLSQGAEDKNTTCHLTGLIPLCLTIKGVNTLRYHKYHGPLRSHRRVLLPRTHGTHTLAHAHTYPVRHPNQSCRSPTTGPAGSLPKHTTPQHTTTMQTHSTRTPHTITPPTHALWYVHSHNNNNNNACASLLTYL